MMKYLLSCLICLLVSFTIAQTNKENIHSDTKPNIILILSDDHGQWATGCYGQDQILTPNMDAMASNGIRFANAMVNAPVCSPSRATLYTGRLPSQHGLHDFLSENEKYNANWLEDEVLLSEKMQDLGYRTALFGKWHCSTSSKKPQAGFDQWLSYDQSIAGWQNTYLHKGKVYFSDNGIAKDHTGFQANFLSQSAIEFIDNGEQEPFFISLNLVEPHFPFEGLPERLVAYYRTVVQDILPAGGSSEAQHFSSSELMGKDHLEKLAQYLAAVSLIDEQIGKIWEALEGRNMLNNTILVYASDHGLLMGQYGLYGKVNASHPFNFYEETIRIPLIIMGPEGICRPGQVRNEFVDLCDLHQLFLELGGAQIPQERDPEQGPGQSLLPLLKGERIPYWRHYHFAEHGNGRMISDGKWKLVRYYQQNPQDTPIDYWYDLSHPLGEAHGSAPPCPETQIIFIQELENYFSIYENETHSGRSVWEQPPCNAKEPWRTIPVNKDTPNPVFD